MNCQTCCGRTFILLPVHPKGKETSIPIEHLRHEVARFDCPACVLRQHEKSPVTVPLHHRSRVVDLHGNTVEQQEIFEAAKRDAAHAIADEMFRARLINFQIDKNEMDFSYDVRASANVMVPGQKAAEIEASQRWQRLADRVRRQNPMVRTDVQRYRDTLDVLQYIVMDPGKMEKKPK